MATDLTSPEGKAQEFRRVSGFTAACVLVSNVIGSGIFTTTGFMARDLGDAGTILALWIAGALLALTGAMSYSELGAALPQAGGEYVYLSRAYGSFLGFLSGWVSFTVGFSAAIAAAAVSFASYFLQLVPLDSLTGILGKSLALGLVWLMTAVHLAGVGPGGLLQRVLTIVKVGAVFLLILAALAVGQGDWANLALHGTPSPALGTIVVSLIFVIYAYSGWNVAGYLAGEISDPERNIPRTMILGTLFVGAVYVSLNVVYFYALPIKDLASEPILPVAEKTANALFGAAAAHFVAGMLCLSIAGAVSAMIWAGPRVYYAMARDGLLPTFFSETGPKGGAPVKSIWLQSTWATVLILTGTFEQLVIYSGFVLTIFSALAVMSVLVLRRSEPGLPRPFRVPWYPLPPGLYLAFAGVIVAYTLTERPVESFYAIVTVLAGAPLYWLLGKSSAQPRP